MHFIAHKKIAHSQQSGFVLLFAVVVSAVIFFIGAGIFSIAYKELLISSLAKDSQKSIFAADSAIECALQAYQDGLFDTANVNLDQYSCFGQFIDDTSSGASNKTFNVKFPNEGTCARVTVDQSVSGLIRFFAQGYNKCSDYEPARSFPGLTERVYQVELGVPVE